MNSIPRTAVYLFTDLQNSTPLWEQHPDLMRELLARHDALLRAAILSHRGQVVKTTGDGFHAVFQTAADGLSAAVAGQQALLQEPWPEATGPLRVRMGLHTGQSWERDGDYYGPEVNRAARVMGLAHGSQILVSGAVTALLRTSPVDQVTLLDLGEHRLRGLGVTEHIAQVCHPALPIEFPPLKSLSGYKHNLPLQLSTFVGRQQEISDIKRLLKETRLLTLLGPGGTGKTRLMLESAEEVIAAFSDGIWLVELASLTDPGLLAERVAAALTVEEQPGRSIQETLVDFLRHKDLLLLLDNVEHLVRECAGLAEQLLTRCPKLKILVTGREALFIPGELTLQIPSLSMPGSGDDVTLDEIRRSEGVQLFLTRAQEFHPQFELTQENAAAITAVVNRLDGIPLALELAAARLRMLSVDQIAARLNDRFRLLTGGRRTALPRMQTLQAMIDWSWNLLDSQEQRLLQRLAVFSGGWTLGAAQAVIKDESMDEYDVIDILEQLVNKSLVTVSNSAGGETRYGLLESIHQYSRDRLLAAHEGEQMRSRHAAYFAVFAAEAGPHRTRSTMLLWLPRISREVDNLRAAVTWALEHQPELALLIAGNLLYREAYWLSPSEAESWLEPAIEKTRPLLAGEGGEQFSKAFILALHGLTWTYVIQGHPARGLPFMEESIQLARSGGELRPLVFAVALKHMISFHLFDSEGQRELEEVIRIGREHKLDSELAFALRIYGSLLYVQGKIDQAMPYFEEAIQIARRTNDPGHYIGFVDLRGHVAEINEDWAEAKKYRLAALEHYQALNHRRSIAVHQSGLAHILRHEGSLEEAEAQYRSSIIRWQEIGQLPAVAHQLECFAYIAIARGQFARAATLLGAARQAREDLDAVSKVPQEIEELTQALDRLGAALGQEERDRIMAEGSLINLDDAVQLALDNTRPQYA